MRRTVGGQRKCQWLVVSQAEKLSSLNEVTKVLGGKVDGQELPSNGDILKVFYRRFP